MGVEFMKLSSVVQPPIISSLLVPNILLSNLFSNTTSLCPSLNVRVQISNPYETKGKIYIFDFR
jgi:hypothetical protein